MEHFEATDKLSNLVGQHGKFEQQQKYAEGMRQKCITTRLELNQHREQHGCSDDMAAGS